MVTKGGTKSKQDEKTAGQRDRRTKAEILGMEMIYRTRINTLEQELGICRNRLAETEREFSRSRQQEIEACRDVGKTNRKNAIATGIASVLACIAGRTGTEQAVVGEVLTGLGEKGYDPKAEDVGEILGRVMALGSRLTVRKTIAGAKGNGDSKQPLSPSALGEMLEIFLNAGSGEEQPSKGCDNPDCPIHGLAAQRQREVERREGSRFIPS